jgi:hypothetical protein
MQKKTGLILKLIVLCIIDTIIPVPIMGSTLVYVVLTRPSWFRDLVREVYGD